MTPVPRFRRAQPPGIRAFDVDPRRGGAHDHNLRQHRHEHVHRPTRPRPHQRHDGGDSAYNRRRSSRLGDSKAGLDARKMSVTPREMCPLARVDRTHEAVSPNASRRHAGIMRARIPPRALQPLPVEREEHAATRENWSPRKVLVPQRHPDVRRVFHGESGSCRSRRVLRKCAPHLLRPRRRRQRTLATRLAAWRELAAEETTER